MNAEELVPIACGFDLNREGDAIPIIFASRECEIQKRKQNRHKQAATLQVKEPQEIILRPIALHSARMLVCPVRDCHLALAREERRLFCPRGHSFDVARSGYINLLQPQDRRSRQPGDTAEAVAARPRLHDRGVTEPLLHAIAQMMAPSPGDIVLDAGCGDGFYSEAWLAKPDSMRTESTSQFGLWTPRRGATPNTSGW